MYTDKNAPYFRLPFDRSTRTSDHIIKDKDICENHGEGMLNKRKTAYFHHPFEHNRGALYYQLFSSPSIKPPHNCGISQVTHPTRDEPKKDLQDEILNAASILIHMNKYHEDSKYCGPILWPKEEKKFSIKKDSFSAHCNPRRLTLAQPEDSSKLNSLHCFVREKLLEIYKVQNKNKAYKKHKTALIRRREEDESCENSVRRVTDDGGDNHASDRDANNTSGIKVGLQCIHCSHLPRKDRSNMSTVHPKNLSDLYRSVCTWQRVHFHQCPLIPNEVRDQYWKLKRDDKTRGKTTYWIESAKKLGLMDCHNGKGICMRRDAIP